MPQQTPDGSLAPYVANEFDGGRIKTWWQDDRMVLFGRKDWLKFDIPLQDLTAGSMNAAYSGPELSIGVRRHILLQKVHKPPIALQQGKHLHRPVNRFGACGIASSRGHRRFSNWRPRDLCRRSFHCLQNVLRDLALKQQGKKTTKGKR